MKAQKDKLLDAMLSNPALGGGPGGHVLMNIMEEEEPTSTSTSTSVAATEQSLAEQRQQWNEQRAAMQAEHARAMQALGRSKDEERAAMQAVHARAMQALSRGKDEELRECKQKHQRAAARVQKEVTDFKAQCKAKYSSLMQQSIDELRAKHEAKMAETKVQVRRDDGADQAPAPRSGRAAAGLCRAHDAE